MRNSLNIGAALLLVTAIIGIIIALQNVFTVPFDEKLLGAAFRQIRAFNKNVMESHDA